MDESWALSLDQEYGFLIFCCGTVSRKQGVKPIPRAFAASSFLAFSSYVIKQPDRKPDRFLMDI